MITCSAPSTSHTKRGQKCIQQLLSQLSSHSGCTASQYVMPAELQEPSQPSQAMPLPQTRHSVEQQAGGVGGGVGGGGGGGGGRVLLTVSQWVPVKPHRQLQRRNDRSSSCRFSSCRLPPRPSDSSKDGWDRQVPPFRQTAARTGRIAATRNNTIVAVHTLTTCPCCTVAPISIQCGTSVRRSACGPTPYPAYTKSG